jgi:hypothetical protein
MILHTRRASLLVAFYLLASAATEARPPRKGPSDTERRGGGRSEQRGDVEGS